MSAGRADVVERREETWQEDFERSVVTGLMALGLVSSAGLKISARRRRSRSRRRCRSPLILLMPTATFRAPFFGDTHLHTSFSMDCRAFGARLGPREAYRFARGEQLTASSGQPVKLSRPLDFLVVADHSDNMGFFPDLFQASPRCWPIRRDANGTIWSNPAGARAAIEIIKAFSQGTFPKDLMYAPGTRPYRGAWRETIASAEQYNEPGRFTAFIGFEWTSNTGGNNLHRNVIFRDNGDKASQVEPFTVYPPSERQPGGTLEMDGGLREQDRRQRAGHRAQRQSEQRPDVPGRRDLRQEDRPQVCRDSGRDGNGSTRPRRPRAMARRIRSCRRTTSSPTSSVGTSAISTAASRRLRRCLNSSMRARR